MTVAKDLENAEEIARRIAHTTGAQRFELHDDLHRSLSRIRLSGGEVPAKLHRLDLDLVDEALEVSFDNMPV